MGYGFKGQGHISLPPLLSLNSNHQLRTLFFPIESTAYAVNNERDVVPLDFAQQIRLFPRKRHRARDVALGLFDYQCAIAFVREDGHSLSGKDRTLLGIRSGSIRRFV
jgi:hypothetical protein